MNSFYDADICPGIASAGAVFSGRGGFEHIMAHRKQEESAPKERYLRDQVKKITLDASRDLG